MNSRAKKRKAIEAEIVRTVNDVEKIPTLTKYFAYNGLNTHSVQRKIWGEEKSGTPYTIQGYELTLKGNAFTARKRLGECIVGKMYELTDEQLEATRKRYTGFKEGLTSTNVIVFVEG